MNKKNFILLLYLCGFFRWVIFIQSLAYFFFTWIDDFLLDGRYLIKKFFFSSSLPVTISFHTCLSHARVGGFEF